MLQRCLLFFQKAWGEGELPPFPLIAPYLHLRPWYNLSWLVWSVYSWITPSLEKSAISTYKIVTRLNSHITCLPNFQEIFHICMLENEVVAVIGRNLVKTYHSAMLQYTVKWSIFFIRKIVFDFRSSGIR